MKALIVNQHTNNYGDDAAGVALVNQLLEKGFQVEIIYLWNESRSKLPVESSEVEHHESRFLSRKNLVNEFTTYLLGKNGYFKFLTEKVKSSDCVFVSPCGANIGIYKDWSFLACVLISVKAGGNVIFHLNTLGKSNSFLFNYIATRVLRNCTIFVREYASLKYLSSKKINAVEGVDTAFSLPVLDKNNTKKTIVFVPTQLNNWHVDFKNSNDSNMVKTNLIPTISEFSKESGLTVEILPHLYGSENEISYLNEIKRLFEEQGADAFISGEIGTYKDYDQTIANAEFVVSMRYHGVILSVKNSTPVISLAYENKMNECCRYSGISDYNISLKDLNARQFKTMLNDMKSNREKLVVKLKEKSALLKAASSYPVTHAMLMQK
jgi:colanic acid/amylovoran biosynthesis protein